MLKKNKKLVIALLVMLFLAGSVMAGITGVTDKWHYRITVEIETPEGTKTGSAVHEVSNSASNIKILDLPEAGNPAAFKGEAVVVDLGERGLVFALVPTTRMFYEAFWGSHGGATTVTGIQHFNEVKLGTTKTVDPKDYPQFVTFRDPNDPKTASLVPTDRFNEVLGEGVKLKGITLERVNEPVTSGIEKWLPWLPCRNQRPGYIDGSHRTPYETVSRTHLTGGSFGFTKTEDSDSAACKTFWEKQEEKENAALKSEFKRWQSLASQGSAEAQFEIGNAYALGYVVPKDYTEAVKWYLKSANQEYPQAMNRLSSFYANGQGVEKDYEESLFWLRLAKKFSGAVTIDENYISKQLTVEQIESVTKRVDEWKPVSQ